MKLLTLNRIVTVQGDFKQFSDGNMCRKCELVVYGDRDWKDSKSNNKYDC